MRAIGGTTGTGALDAIGLEVLLTRLEADIEAAVVDCRRRAYSAVIRLGNDLSLALTTAGGESLVQSRLSAPSHTGLLGHTVRELLARFDPADMSPGDAFITNDPWIGSGHLHDLTIVTPVFLGGELAAFAAANAHMLDVGGVGFATTARDVYEEGFQLPPVRLRRRDELNDDVAEIVVANSRAPVHMRHDMFGLLAACDRVSEAAVQRLAALGPAGWRQVGETLLARTEQKLRSCIESVRPGEHRAEIALDMDDGDARIVVSARADGDVLVVDFTGTSPQSTSGINSTRGYTCSYAVYAIKCALVPDEITNDGTLRAVRFITPERTLVNAAHPAPVVGRHVVGHYIPQVVLVALAAATGRAGMAESGAPGFRAMLRESGSNGGGGVFILASGGMGALHGSPGLDCTAFPSNASPPPVESFEQEAPIEFLRKTIRRGSGGAGAFEGGNGQTLTIRHRGGPPLFCEPVLDRTVSTPRGLGGGSDGAPAELALDGRRISGHERCVLEPGATLDISTAGGGGWGAPGG